MSETIHFKGFSDDSSSSEEFDYVKSESKLSGRGQSESDSKKLGGTHPNKRAVVKPAADVPDSFIEYDKTRIGTLEPNTIIRYRKVNGKLIESKYFKKVDNIAGTIIVGFYTHNKKNYAESLKNISAIYVSRAQIGGGSDNLKETIEIQKNDWSTLKRDMVISYQKKDNEFVYKAKFNSFIKGADGTTRMSLTTEQGYNFRTNPDNIKKIYRHVTSNDKMLTHILEAMRKLENRVRALEQKKM